MDSKTLSDLIGLIYDAATDINKWSRLQKALSDELGPLLDNTCDGNLGTRDDLIEMIPENGSSFSEIAIDAFAS